MDCTDILYVPKVTVPILTFNVPKLAIPNKNMYRKCLYRNCHVLKETYMSGYRDCSSNSSLLGDTESGQQTFIHTDSPDGGTGKTCLGGDVHCLNASS